MAADASALHIDTRASFHVNTALMPSVSHANSTSITCLTFIIYKATIRAYTGKARARGVATEEIEQTGYYFPFSARVTLGLAPAMSLR